MNTKNSIVKLAIACAAAGWLCWNPCTLLAQAPAPGLSPDLQEVVRLSQAKMPDDVIKNYIGSTGRAYHLSADDIIYLSSQGVSSGVIGALQATSLAPAPAPVAPPPAQPTPMPEPAPVGDPAAPAPAPVTVQVAPPGPASVAVQVAVPAPAPVAVAVAAPAPEVNFGYFHDQLAPFGTWININGMMYWRPDQALAVNPDWRPYYDMGQWVETENGLYWQSDYTWGDIPFHYGRWALYPGYGWLWAPDYVWGPAWVFWRHDEVDGVIGWAPLPVGAVFVDGGFRYHGVIVGADFDFGLGEACFTFVGYDHFHEGFFRMRGHEWAWHIDHAHLHGFYGHSVIRNDFHRDEHGRFVNNGIGHDRMEHLTHVEHQSFQERNPVGDRNHAQPEQAHRDDHNAPHPGGPGNAGNTQHTQPGGASHPAAPAPSKVYRPPTSSAQQTQSKDRR